VTLTRRLLLSYLAVVAVTSGVLIIAADRQLRSRLEHEATLELEREARYFAAAASAVSPARLDTLVHELGRVTGRRLTIVDRSGNVIADSDFPPGQLTSLENHASRPEIVAAYAGRTGIDLRVSTSTGRPELKVAVPFGSDVARVSSPLPQVDAVVRRAQGAILLGAAAAAAIAAILSWGFSRRVARPLLRLSDAAQAIARGEHPAVDTRGRDEVGELARALRTVDENLSARLWMLQQERSRTEALIASMVEGVLACDASGAVLSANPAARRLLAIDPDRPVPPARELFRPRAASDAVEVTMAGGTVDGREVEIGERQILLSGRALPGGGAVFVLHDITALKRLETVRRDFVANVSHELKTPLTVVRGYAETLATGDPPPDTRARFLNAILDNARRMQRLIDDLLDLSRIESRAWAPQPEAVSLEPLARDVWRLVGGPAALEVAVAPDAATVSADAEAVRQILGNILENAQRYTTAGGRVTVRAARSGPMVKVEISDTGAGIPGEHLPRIFERFYRVDPHRSREAGGTGLGLAIVKHLVEAHGGRVEADSRLGAGTTVRFTLPASLHINAD
jgi:signal transduction histidine kinase